MFSQITRDQSTGGEAEEITARRSQEVRQSPFATDEHGQADGSHKEIDPDTDETPAASEKQPGQQHKEILEYQRNGPDREGNLEISANRYESGHQRGIDHQLQLLPFHRAQPPNLKVLSENGTKTWLTYFESQVNQVRRKCQ